MANSVYVLRVKSIDLALLWFRDRDRLFLVIGVDPDVMEVYVEAGPWAKTCRYIEKQSWCIDKVIIKKLLY